MPASVQPILYPDGVDLLQHLDVRQVDVFGFSVGGAVALHLAIRHPEVVRKLIVSSASFDPGGDRSENSDAVGSMTVDIIVGTPMEEEYRAKSPPPDRLQDLAGQAGHLRPWISRLVRRPHPAQSPHRCRTERLSAVQVTRSERVLSDPPDGMLAA